MLKYLTGVRWQDRGASEKVLKRCDVEDIWYKFTRSSLRWFGLVERAGEERIKERAKMMEVAGRRSVGRPKKSRGSASRRIWRDYE